MPRLKVREADDVAQALGRAYQVLQSRTVERDRAKLKEEQARVLTGMMDEFVANVSHELRTPLTSIAGSLGLLANGVAGVLPAAPRQWRWRSPGWRFARNAAPLLDPVPQLDAVVPVAQLADALGRRHHDGVLR